MRVFIAGATGVLGKRVVNQLIAAGHEVGGLSRSAANAAWLGEHGATALPGDLFNADQVRELSAGYEAILHLATAIPTGTRPKAADWSTNDRIRREGTAALVNAAIQNQVRLYVQQSVTYLYGDHGDDWVDESTPIVRPNGGVLESAADMEQMVNEALDKQGLPAVNLRCGMFYGRDSVQTQAMLAAIGKGYLPIIGDGKAFWSPIHVDDAAAAVVACVQNPTVGHGQTFNVVDNEPVRYEDFANNVAAMMGARRPIHLPMGVAKVLLGNGLVYTFTTSTRVRNGRMRDTFGWSPRYLTYREGYGATIDQLAAG